MVKRRKGFNWKARETVKVKTDDSFRKTISIEIDGKHSYDESNPLVLPSKKRKTKVKRNETRPIKILSKKQKKRLEKIVEKKKKKLDRTELLKSLLAVQGTPELLSRLTSISDVQTKGLKRMYEACNEVPNVVELSDTKKFKFHSSLKGRRKVKIERPKISGPNIVGFSSSGSDDDDSIDENGDNNEPVECDNTTHDVEITSVQERDTEVLKIDPGLELETESAPKSKDETVVELIKTESIRSNETASLETSSTAEKKFVLVDRLPEIQRARLKLPIIGEEQTIMEAIQDKDIVIISGETGSGKTTQLPQFLYEAGYSLNGRMIGITEPRRVAATSMARRVAEELNLNSDIVSYLIRFEGNTTPKTQIKFMTDGILLREIRNDALLRKYSVIILDEAHERSIYTDILIGVLSRIASHRRKKFNFPLKLIIMSATLRLSEFTENIKLFKTPPPVIRVDSRQYPVAVHFNKITAIDYMREAYRKTCKIHTQLPEGSILIFLTGQQEVNTLVKKLRRTFPYHFEKKTLTAEESEQENEQNDEEVYEIEESDDEIDSKALKQKLKKININSLPEIHLEDYATRPDEDDELDEEFIADNVFPGGNFQPMWVLPLYSFLDSKKQTKVFEAPPEGCRLCVVATNVAETSLTIPSVKYVVDSGRTKVRLYDKVTGVSTFTVQWTSKASANQRAGRAGRTAAGHCYRLYSSAVFNNEFEEWSAPEIQRKPVDDLMLQMKSLGIDRVVDFPFPSPPDATQLKAAEKLLLYLGALEEFIHFKDEWKCKLTSLGQSMAAFPVSPRFAKMLCLSQQFDLMPYTVTIVAALSIQQFLLRAREDYVKIWRTWAKHGNKLLLGDIMVLLTALGSAEYANIEGNMEKFCAEHGLRYKAVVEARKLRVQLTNELNVIMPGLNLSVDPNLKPPTDDLARKLRQIILTGMVDQIAHKLTTSELKEAGLSAQKAAYRIPTINEIVILNSSSVLRKTKPEWIAYQEVYQVNGKLYARGITAIEPEWLPLYAAPLCNLSEPLKNPPPFYEKATGRVMCYVESSFGRSGWRLPVTKIEYPEGEDCYKWFAHFFLKGEVCSRLEVYVDDLLSPPSSVFTLWAKLLKNRCSKFLLALIQKKVHSKEKLLECWKKEDKYLLPQYLEWLPKSASKEIQGLWPPE